MSSPATIHAATSQGPSVRRWLLAFFSPTYLFAIWFLMAAIFRDEVQVPGGTFIVLLGIASGASLWLCLREVMRVHRPVWQKGLLTAATIAVLAAQTIVDGLFFGFLSMALWGFPGPS